MTQKPEDKDIPLPPPPVQTIREWKLSDLRPKTARCAWGTCYLTEGHEGDCQPDRRKGERRQGTPTDAPPDGQPERRERKRR